MSNTSSSSNGAFQGAAPPLLEIKHVSVDYHADNGTVHALTDVSVTLERGQILGLAGESGSGKSTLGYAITRLLKPPAAITGGEVLYYPKASRVGGAAAAQPIDVDFDHVGGALPVGVPEVFAEHFAGNDLPGVPHEQL